MSRCFLKDVVSAGDYLGGLRWTAAGKMPVGVVCVEAVAIAFRKADLPMTKVAFHREACASSDLNQG